MSRDIRQEAKALNVIDARDLIKAKFPANPPQLSAVQLDQIQRVLDAYFINLDVDRQLEELDRRSIVGRTREGRAVHDDSKRVSQDTLQKVKKNRIVLKEEKLIIRLDYEKLLAAGALSPTSDNPDEAAYLLRVKAALATQGLWLNIFRDSSQMGRTQYTAPNDHRGWFAVLYYGGDKRHEITTDTGRLTRQDLLKMPLFKIWYHDYVHNGPTLRLLRAAVNAASSKVRVMVALHHDYSNKSIRGKVLDWALREGVGRQVGWKVEYPEEKIWDEPAQLLTKALNLIDRGKLGEANKLVILAAYQAEWNAKAVMQYVNFVEAVKPGVGVGLRILQIAETLGKIADAILFLRAAGKGVFRLLSGKGSPPSLPAPSTSSPSRQLPAAGQSSASNPVEVYQSAVKNAENVVQPAARSTPSAQSVAPSAGKGGTIVDPLDAPRANLAGGPANPSVPKGPLVVDTNHMLVKDAWYNSTGRLAYVRDQRQYQEYVLRELQHLQKVNPNATLTEKGAVFDRADKIWGKWMEGDNGIPSKYLGEQINVDLPLPKK